MHGDQVLRAHSAAEEFVSVIEVRDHLDVVDGGSAAYSTQSETVDLVVGTDDLSTMAQTHIAEYTAVVLVHFLAHGHAIQVASVACCKTFDGAYAVRCSSCGITISRALVGVCTTQYDQASPLAAVLHAVAAVQGVSGRGHDDRAGFAAIRPDLTFTCHDDGMRCTGVRVGFDHRSRLDEQVLACVHVQTAVQRVQVVTGQRRRRAEQVLGGGIHQGGDVHRRSGIHRRTTAGSPDGLCVGARYGHGCHTGCHDRLAYILHVFVGLGFGSFLDLGNHLSGGRQKCPQGCLPMVSATLGLCEGSLTVPFPSQRRLHVDLTCAPERSVRGTATE